MCKISSLCRQTICDGRCVSIEIPEVVDEALATRRIVADAVFQSLLLEPSRLRLIHHAAPSPARASQNLRMISLWSAIECGQEIMGSASHIEFVEKTATSRCNPHIERFIKKTHFRTTVKVEIRGRGIDPRPCPASRRVGGCVGTNEFPVDGVSQMREIDSAKGTVPVSTVALCTIERRNRLFKGLWFNHFFTATEKFKSIAHHHHASIHFVCFRISQSKVPPTATAYKFRCASQSRIGISDLTGQSARG